MKYKVGDRVKIRSDLEKNEYYDYFFFLEEMDKYKGKILTISRIDNKKYWFEELSEAENRACYFNDEMIESVIYEIGDYLVANEKSGYCFTNKNVLCKVVKDERPLRNHEDISVIAVYDFETGEETYDRLTYRVESKYFNRLWRNSNNGKKEMTVSEIEKALGYSIKVVRE